jgi:hypothetical protein
VRWILVLEINDGEDMFRSSDYSFSSTCVKFVKVTYFYLLVPVSFVWKILSALLAFTKIFERILLSSNKVVSYLTDVNKTVFGKYIAVRTTYHY